ncbi:hypothetical protein BZG36_01356 [Bifiguratus adelaidae]|uniref:Methylcrotonoyl-CoA carboxylase subunit alpha, mitochondrial n=1 Tax=Bifiguratus adelaidae TaxID=1938954 RepID=A0A261Y3C1_9FUNG|nr:hypothetical protein BZG36_01356 [Bifiguratus adelaidae]
MKQPGLTCAPFTSSDAAALFVKQADEAVHIGPSPASESYLVGQKIIDAAIRTGADAIHPGYGFLSENAEFASAVRQAGLIFIGPSAESIQAIGDKIGAKELLSAKLPQVPLIPGYNGADQSLDRLVSEAKRIQFPVLLKASAGGGGKGMRIVREAKALQEQIETAQSESLRAFGSDRLLIERYFESVRHVEIQIMGDQHGHVVALGERDCSVQRRHQKVIEETPSPGLLPDTRQKMNAAAAGIGSLLGYEGAGTVEFILDTKTQEFYFLEVNTRLQVEHPITEETFGLDLVRLQIFVAQGYSLEEIYPGLDSIQPKGHAIEARIYAEDPDNDFLPCTGTICKWIMVGGQAVSDGGIRVGEGNGIRIRYDTGIEDDSQISIYYDPMIAKLTVWAPTRLQAVAHLERALGDTVLLGLTTNQRFLVNVLRSDAFRRGEYDTGYIEATKEHLLYLPAEITQSAISSLAAVHGGVHHKASKVPSPSLQETVIPALLFRWVHHEQQRTTLKHLPFSWRYIRYKLPKTEFAVNLDTTGDAQTCAVEYEELPVTHGTRKNGDFSGRKFRMWMHVQDKDKGAPIEVILGMVDFDAHEERVTGRIRCDIGGIQRTYHVHQERLPTTDEVVSFVYHREWARQIRMVRVERLKVRAAGLADGGDDVSPYTSPMPCKILKILVPSGSKVQKDQPLLTLESMKTEVKVYSRHEGIVDIRVSEGDLVEAGVEMCRVKS